MAYHLALRNSRYYYICRVPADLLSRFPSKKICRSLKTTNKNSARILASEIESKTQGLFMKLRAGVFDEHTKAKMLTQFMRKELTSKEAEIHGRVFGDDAVTKSANAFAGYLAHLDSVPDDDPIPFYVRLANTAKADEYSAKLGLQNGGNSYSEEAALGLAQKFNVKLSDAESKYMQRQMLQFKLHLAQAELDARLNSDWSKLDGLRVKLDREIENVTEKYYLKDISKSYYSSFETDPEKKGILLNSWRAVKRQVEFIVKTFGGNAELSLINSKKGKEKLQMALAQKRKSTGDKISSKESSEYMKRLSTLVKFAIDEHELDITNRITGTFKSVGSEKPRDSFSHTDIKNLVNALCTVQIVFGRGRIPRNDRFWIILIALLHGLRESSIVNLRFRHLVADDDTDILCFDLRKDAALLRTKTDSMKILCPVHPVLISLGFLEWIDSRNLTMEEKLFEDTPSSFGQWFNGLTPTSGWNYDNITQEDKKVFHSFRHYFRMLGRDLGLSDKEIDEMSGHARSTKGSIGTKHYDERTQAQRFSDIQARMMEEGRFLRKDLDIDRLKVRASELFFPDAVI